jgi:4-diphosphocytidyl-2C-methyl-D-erythritol kinase
MKTTVKAPAKINLTLEVLSKRPDGYHEISTIMQAVSLYDTVTLSSNDSGEITISCNYDGVPCDEKNICCKAAERYFEYTKQENKGLHIDIDKQIPTQAGLAGGSSDGAAVLRLMRRVYAPHMAAEELERIGAVITAAFATEEEYLDFCRAHNIRIGLIDCHTFAPDQRVTAEDLANFNLETLWYLTDGRPRLRIFAN